jgi:hypothetical protein
MEMQKKQEFEEKANALSDLRTSLQTLPKTSDASMEA